MSLALKYKGEKMAFVHVMKWNSHAPSHSDTGPNVWSRLQSGAAVCAGQCGDKCDHRLFLLSLVYIQNLKNDQELSELQTERLFQ